MYPYNIFVLLLISVVLPYFTSSSYDYFYQKDEKNKPVKKVHFSPVDTDLDNKTLTMIVIGLFYVLFGVVVSVYTNSIALIGVSLGGTLLLVHNIIRKWYKFTKKQQILILGSVLLCLIIVGTFYKL